MPNHLTTGLVSRSRQLAAQLDELRSRVREAVAAELARVVADAVRDLLTAALRGRPPEPEGTTPRRSGPVRDDPWDDDPDDWRRDGDDESDRYRDDPDERHPPPGPTTNDPRPSAHWVSALSTGILVARWLLAHRLRLWPAVGAGVVISALAGGSAVRVAFAAVATALELVCLTQSDPG